MNLKPSEKYSFCGVCKKFHEHSDQDHIPVDRKLCFICDKVSPGKTIIFGSYEVGFTQICEICMDAVKRAVL